MGSLLGDILETILDCNKNPYVHHHEGSLGNPQP